MSAEAISLPPQPNIQCLQELYSQFGADLVEARNFIAQECSNQEMRKQFDDLEAEAMYLLIRATRPETLVEISPCDGWSTTWILKALSDNQIGSLDSFDMHDGSKKFVPTSLAERWYLHVGDARRIENQIPEEIDFLLIDSKHTQGFAKWYLKKVLPKVKPASLIVIHDIESGIPMPAIADTWTGFNPVGSEGWRVQKELQKRQIGYFTLCNTLKNPTGYINGRFAELERTKLGISDNFSEQHKNPSVFFFQTT